jgi:hypothetical protein
MPRAAANGYTQKPVMTHPAVAAASVLPEERQRSDRPSRVPPPRTRRHPVGSSAETLASQREPQPAPATVCWRRVAEQALALDRVRLQWSDLRRRDLLVIRGPVAASGPAFAANARSGGPCETDNALKRSKDPARHSLALVAGASTNGSEDRKIRICRGFLIFGSDGSSSLHWSRTPRFAGASWRAAAQLTPGRSAAAGSAESGCLDGNDDGDSLHAFAQARRLARSD